MLDQSQTQLLQREPAYCDMASPPHAATDQPLGIALRQASHVVCMCEPGTQALYV